MKTLLVIEDVASLREEIAEHLSFEGFHVLSAENGAVGVQIAREHHPQLVICDLMMPVMDGYGVIETLKTDPATCQIPIILLTAQSSADTTQKALALGASECLLKPFYYNELIKRIRHLIS